MTHEEILGASADDLEKMSDADLLKWYEPMLKVTRPELAEKPSANKTPRKIQGPKSSRATELLKQMGIEF